MLVLTDSCFWFGAQSESPPKPKRARKPNPSEVGVSAELRKRLRRLHRSEVAQGTITAQFLKLYKTDMQLPYLAKETQAKDVLEKQILDAFDRTGGRGRPARLPGFSNTEYTPRLIGVRPI